VISIENERRSGVYIILHLPSKRVYVGQAANIYKRWSVHKFHLRVGSHHCTYLQRVWNKYGEQEFEFRIVQFGTIDMLDKLEEKWFARFEGLLLNAHPPGKSARGFILPELARRKISEAQKLVGADIEERRRRSDRAKRQHKEGTLRRKLSRPIRTCTKCGKLFNQYKLFNNKHHQGNRCLTCMAEHFATNGGQFNIHKFDVTVEEFDDAAYELTWKRMYNGAA
jgi:group I intron endonuclease